MTLLVLCDHDRGVVSDSAYEALTFAKPISEMKIFLYKQFLLAKELKRQRNRLFLLELR